MQPIAIACGDHAGIGPEITLKAVAAELGEDREGRLRFVLVGDRTALDSECRSLGLGLRWSAYPDLATQVAVLDPRSETLAPRPGHPSAATAQAALDYLREAAIGCQQGRFSALVTAPVSKETILRSGQPFVGQTEYLAALCGSPEVTMMLLGDDEAGRWLRVALVTTHLPLRQVADAVTRHGVVRAIRHAARACRTLDLPLARIAVCGLNPHAGEGGMLGEEDMAIIAPAVEEARGAGIEVIGPVAADTVFHHAREGAFEAVVAMYHDQGLAPLKTIAFDRGVNWTIGLPFPRTSPDHGTAFNLAGRGTARPASMRAALRLAIRLGSAGGGFPVSR